MPVRSVRTLEQLIRQVVQDCRQHDIALFLEPVSYSIDPRMEKESRGFAEIRLELIARIAERLGNLGPRCIKARVSGRRSI